MNANAVAKTLTFEVEQILIFSGGKQINLGKKIVKRPIDRPMHSHITYRAEWLEDPCSAYRWSWFDQHEDLVNIIYLVKDHSSDAYQTVF